jgi:ABC-2 type transport system permease protein
MTTSLRAEMVRLGTLRSSYGTLAALLVLVGGITAISLASAGEAGFTTSSQLREPVTASAGILAAVALALFAAMGVAGEYRYGTIGQRLLAAPRRQRLLATAFVSHGLLALVVGSVGLALSLAIARAMLPSQDQGLGMTAQIAGCVLLAVFSFSLIGVCCGVLLRSQSSAVLVIVGMFVAEKVLGVVIGGASAYLPYGLLTPLLQLEGATTGSGPAIAALLSITVGLMAVTCLVFARRDLST